jgi:hypothetical protein
VDLGAVSAAAAARLAAAVRLAGAATRAEAVEAPVGESYESFVQSGSMISEQLFTASDFA